MSSTTALKKVFEPLQLGKVQLPNRILMSGMHLGFEKDQDQFASLARFFEIRAKGEVGLVVVGGCSPDKIGRVIYKDGLCISSDDLIEQHRKVTNAIKKHGSKSALQLCPFGRESFHSRLMAPSPVKAHANLYTPKEISEEDIEASVDRFAQAISRTKQAGYDAVEIVGSQGFLIHQFFAPRTNRRSDKWGGSIENRARYAVEVIRRSRKLVGDYPIIFRMPSLDLVKNGVSESEFLPLLKIIAAEKPDLINVGVGWHDSSVPTIAMNVPAASFAPVANYVKNNCDIPVAVSNRINDLRIAERVLQEGMADVIAMGRPLLADPFIVKKSKEGNWNGINTCIACNQACLDNALRGKKVGCIVNPQCGHDEENKTLLTKNKKVFQVVGGGLAGMSAALWLKKTGHSVTLFEKDTVLGGQIHLATKIPNKEIFSETLRHLEHELYKNRVDVQKSYQWKLSDAQECDHVVVATGAVPRELNAPIDPNANYYTYDEVLRNKIPLVSPVVIIGSGAISIDLVGYIHQESDWLQKAIHYITSNVDTSLAEKYKNYADKKASPITVLGRSRKSAGSTIGATTRWINLQKFENHTNFIKRVKVLSVEESAVTVEHIVEKRIEKIPAGTVICAIGQESNNSLENVMKNSEVSYSTIGLDQCKNIRYSAGEAIKQGYKLAMQFL